MQTLPINLSLNAGDTWNSAPVDVPSDSAAAIFVLDSSWLTDPTAVLAWGIEHSRDGGQTWLALASGSRRGGAIDKFTGQPLTTLDIAISLSGIRGEKLRAYMGYLLGDTNKPNHVNVTGTITLT